MVDLPRTDIVLGLLREPDGRVWAELRPDGKHLAGLRAFPGGKRVDGETPRAALVRELDEEIGIRVQRARRLITLDWDYPDRHLRLIGFEVTAWAGWPRSVEGQALLAEPLDRDTRGDWLAAMPSANRGLVNALVLPRCIAITPPVGIDGLTAWQARIESYLHSLPAPMMVNLRPGSATTNVDLPWPALARAVLAAGHWPVANPASGHPWPKGLDPRVGLHLNHGRLMSMRAEEVWETQVCGHLVSAAVHDRATLARAVDLAVDLVIVSPLRQTATHPGVSGMGWAAFAQLAAAASMPVYALGGVGPHDLPCVWRRGGFGVAAISAFW
ncbi:thiamine phosphate synthase [Guyparkeria sp.]|uniref:thiamine phosphate synthase n=1 Tax=Guyparkeria sp. TaxID=2035736 RepID=UPI003970E6FA